MMKIAYIFVLSGETPYALTMDKQKVEEAYVTTRLGLFA
jgi:hypothetical protein